VKLAAVRISIFVASVTWTVLVGGETVAPTLDEVRTLGREKSRFLGDRNRTLPFAGGVPKPDLDQFSESIGPILAAKCVACHGPSTSHGNLRIDQLDPDLLSGADQESWRGIYKVLSNSEMPPEDEPEYRIADAERSTMVEWISAELNKASVMRRNRSPHTSFRRMTKQEYNYALQDLLGLRYALGNALPPETASEDGFMKSSEMLQMSAMQFEAYRKIGLEALKRVTVGRDRPQTVTYQISMQQEMEKVLDGKNPKTFNRADENYNSNRQRQHLFDRSTGDGVPFSNGKTKPEFDALGGKIPAVSQVVLALPRSNELKWNLDRFLPDEGTMRVRIRVGRTTMKPQEFASLRLIFSAHTSNNANFSEVISSRDLAVTASAQKPEYVHFDIPLSEIQRNPFRKLETKFPRRDEFLHVRNISNGNNRDEPLQLLIDHIEITAPHFDQWPPKTHTDIFFASENRGEEAVYAREVLTRFLTRVWRRPATSVEVEQYMDLFSDYRPQFEHLEDAMLEVLATALASPEFLYLTQYSGTDERQTSRSISDTELASRLSFFLWSSIPDAELLSLASQGRLSNPDVLSKQVSRMLEDPRASRFSTGFVQQWLGLDGLKTASHIADDELLKAMQEEPIAYFEIMLRQNASVMDFLHSNYVAVNERLARHYGIRDVFGPQFRQVAVETSAHRGGVLTGAAVLAMNSDGQDSHPLKRGIWLLERILHDPPPPPPPDVPEVDLTDPRIMEMTLKERIADHRNKPACISCHSRIDPWGIAFENYDAMGSFRTKIGSEPVDATSALFNQQELAGVDGLKRYLLMHRQDQFAKAMVHKMSAYALGRPLSLGDRADIDRITVEFRKSGDRLADLIQLIAHSRLFNGK